jgi:hypothetical protein
MHVFMLFSLELIHRRVVDIFKRIDKNLPICEIKMKERPKVD